LLYKRSPQLMFLKDLKRFAIRLLYSPISSANSWKPNLSIIIISLYLT